ncbi:hypothetical protein FIBSPDRAFT_24459 [Athelia psychrophila]|uniref:Uncharacterized protein n=1 Tax=Athelia psychrophila TaxID=1759441 RepID=A0A166G7Q6_9AGAM|nr:hypothetical protein FIBSPDRAFT_24459 [Fibularhizoctonia sp. CBS 109695]
MPGLVAGLGAPIYLPRSRDLDDILHAQLHPLFDSQRVGPCADRLISSGEPVKNAVAASEDDLVDGNGGCGKLIDGEELDALEAPFCSEVEDRSPLGCVLFCRAAEVAG